MAGAGWPCLYGGQVAGILGPGPVVFGGGRGPVVVLAGVGFVYDWPGYLKNEGK